MQTPTTNECCSLAVRRRQLKHYSCILAKAFSRMTCHLFHIVNRSVTSVLPLPRPPEVIKSTKIQTNMYTWYYSRLRGRTTVAQAPLHGPNRYLATLSAAPPARFVIHSSTAASSEYGCGFIEKNNFEVLKNQANCNTFENYHNRSQTKGNYLHRSKVKDTRYNVQNARLTIPGTWYKICTRNNMQDMRLQGTVAGTDTSGF